MNKISLIVTSGTQFEKTLLAGFIKAKDIINIHELDEWKAGRLIEEKECQRKPIVAYYKKIGKGYNEPNALMPTSIVMSVVLDKEGKSDKIKIKDTMYEDIKILEIYSKIRITDGVHRIFGAEYSINELRNSYMEDFEFPSVLILANDRVDENLAFYEINSKSKNVATDLDLQLLNEINKGREREFIKIEKWKLLALNVAMEINKNKNSVWFNNISVEQTKQNEIASSVSFVTSLKPFLDIPFIKDVDKESKSSEEAAKEIAYWLNVYWEGIKLAISTAFPKKELINIRRLFKKHLEYIFGICWLQKY